MLLLNTCIISNFYKKMNAKFKNILKMLSLFLSKISFDQLLYEGWDLQFIF